MVGAENNWGAHSKGHGQVKQNRRSAGILCNHQKLCTTRTHNHTENRVYRKAALLRRVIMVPWSCVSPPKWELWGDQFFAPVFQNNNRLWSIWNCWLWLWLTSFFRWLHRTINTESEFHLWGIQSKSLETAHESAIYFSISTGNSGATGSWNTSNKQNSWVNCFLTKCKGIFLSCQWNQ
jgi:hypothetical protein